MIYLKLSTSPGKTSGYGTFAHLLGFIKTDIYNYIHQNHSKLQCHLNNRILV